MGAALIITVQRRFPTYDATLRVAESCDCVRSRLPGPDYSGDSFVLLRTKRGIYGLLQPSIAGSIAENEIGGCDVRFRVAYPRLWWVLDIGLFLALNFELLKSPPTARPVLLLALAILIAVTLFSLQLKGRVFASRVAQLISTGS